MPETLQFDVVESAIEKSEEYLFNGTSFLYDFENGDFIYRDGNPIKITGKEAIKVWIEKVIRTRINTYDIYEQVDEDGFSTYREYGTNLLQLTRGRKLPVLLIRAEVQRDIEEALLRNDKIKRIDNFNLQLNKNGETQRVGITFNVVLVDNEDIDMEVSI